VHRVLTFRKHWLLPQCSILGTHWSGKFFSTSPDMISNVLWRIDPLLGNDSVNTFPRKRTHATIWRPLLRNGSVNKLQQYRDCAFCVVRAEVLWRGKEGRMSYRELGRVWDGSRRWLRSNCTRWIRLCKEDIMCDLKWQWDCYNP
jgi:hypothetical protein